VYQASAPGLQTFATQLEIRLHRRTQALEVHIALMYVTVCSTIGNIMTFAPPVSSGDVGSHVAPNGSEGVSANGAVVLIVNGGM
jgi:hypothetical protein